MQAESTEMTTLTSVLETLRIKREDNEFLFTEQGFTVNENKYYQPEELKLLRTYRFEGDSDPADNAVLYLLQAKDGLIGYSIDVYGAESNHADGYDEFIKQIPAADPAPYQEQNQQVEVEVEEV